MPSRQPSPIGRIYFSCSNGHAVNAPVTWIGRLGICPECRESVSIEGPRKGLTDAEILKLLDPSRDADEIAAVDRTDCHTCGRPIYGNSAFCPFCRVSMSAN